MAMLWCLRIGCSRPCKYRIFLSVAAVLSVSSILYTQRADITAVHYGIVVRSQDSTEEQAGQHNQSVREDTRQLSEGFLPTQQDTQYGGAVKTRDNPIQGVSKVYRDHASDEKQIKNRNNLKDISIKDDLRTETPDGALNTENNERDNAYVTPTKLLEDKLPTNKPSETMHQNENPKTTPSPKATNQLSGSSDTEQTKRITNNIRDTKTSLDNSNQILSKVESSSTNKPQSRTPNLKVIQQQPVELMEFPQEVPANSCLKATANKLKMWAKPSRLVVKKEELEKIHPDVIKGHFRPTWCDPIEKMALIIPFRNRYEHLHVLLPNLIRIMKLQGIDFTIFVVEQDLPTSFNKGVVNNAGFIEALKLDDFDCFIFHDVDMLPVSELNHYRCDPRGPLHYMNGVNKFNYKLIYPQLIGGVLGFTRQQYREVNGYSNLYFGWGSEDDDMYHRIVSAGQVVVRRPPAIGYYDMVRHNRDKRWSPNMARFAITKTAGKRRAVDGLNTVRYKLTQVKKEQLYVHIRIAVDMDEVYKTAPSYMKQSIHAARLEDRKNRIKDGTAAEVGYVKPHRQK